MQLAQVKPSCKASYRMLRPVQRYCTMNNAGPRNLSRTFIRAWREHAGLSLEELAGAIGMNKGNLSKVERSLLPYHQEMLEKIADRLECSASDLLMNDPNKPGEFLQAWDRANEAQRAQIRAVAEAIVSYDYKKAD